MTMLCGRICRFMKLRLDRVLKLQLTGMERSEVTTIMTFPPVA